MIENVVLKKQHAPRATNLIKYAVLKKQRATNFGYHPSQENRILCTFSILIPKIRRVSSFMINDF